MTKAIESLSAEDTAELRAVLEPIFGDVLSAEVVEREAADGSLAEADANLAENIDNVQSNLDAQIAARIVVEQGLRETDDNLIANIGSVQSNLDAQIAARIVVEQALLQADGDLAQNIASVEANADSRFALIAAKPALAGADLDRPILANPRSSVVGGSFFGGTFNAYIYGVSVAEAEPGLASLRPWLDGLAGLSQLRITVIDRPLAVGDGGGEEPGGHAQDVLKTVFSTNVADVIANYRVNLPQPTRIGISQAGPLAAEIIRFFMIEALDSGSISRPFGAAIGRAYPVGTPQWKIGWIRDGTSYGPLSPSTPLAFILSRNGQRQQNAEIGYVEQMWESADLEVANKVIPPIVRRDAQGINLSSFDRITFAVPVPVPIDPVPLTLNIGTYAPLEYEPAYGSVQVHRASDNMLLTEFIDYRVDYASGSIVGLLPVALDVLVNYTGLPIRYDVIHEHIVTRAYAVTEGPARGYDACEYIPRISGQATHPEYANAGPTLPVGVRPIYTVRVNWTGAKLIPVHNWWATRKLGQYAEELAWLDYCREYFSPVISKAQRGDPITLTNVGTSLGAQGNDQSIENANGERDMLSFYDTPRIAADTFARITAHDGDAGTGKHQRLGWCWGIKEALEAWGSVVTYLNRGLSGSSTRDVTRGLTNDVRLAPVYADNADIIVADVGENNDGQDYIYEDAVTFIQKVRANSPNSLILLVPGGFNARFSTSVTPEMSGYTYEQVKQAAIDCGVGWLDHALLFGPGREGAVGQAYEDLSLQNGINHDFATVMLAIRRLAARIFRG